MADSTIKTAATGREVEEVRDAPQAPEGAVWVVTLDHHHRPSSGPVIFRGAEDGRRFVDYDDAVAFGQTLLAGEQYTDNRTVVTVGWLMPLRHPDGNF